MFVKVKRNQIEKLLRNLPKYHNKSYTHDLELYKGNAYLKLYYEEEPTQAEVDEVYRVALNLFNEVNYNFKGITYYRDNNEICLAFVKEKF